MDFVHPQYACAPCFAAEFLHLWRGADAAGYGHLSGPRDLAGRVPRAAAALLALRAGQRLGHMNFELPVGGIFKGNKSGNAFGGKGDLIHMAVGQNQWFHFGVGAPPMLVGILVGIGLFIGGTGC